MARIVFSFIKDVFTDGFRIIGLVGPALSAIFWIAKLGFGKTVMLQDWSYAWGFLPLTIWIFVAYLKRWSATSSNLIPVIEQYSQGVDGTGKLVGMMNVTVRNIGPPTILEKWCVVLILPDGRRVTAVMQQISDMGTNLVMDDGKIQTIHAADAIYDKTSATPIPQGSKVGGWLQFYFDSLTANDRSHDNSFEVMFSDVFGKKYCASSVNPKVIEKFKYVPDGTGGHGLKPKGGT